MESQTNGKAKAAFYALAVAAVVMSLGIGVLYAQSATGEVAPSGAQAGQTAPLPSAATCGAEGCACGCKEGKECGCQEGEEGCKCGEGCACGCADGKECNCGKDGADGGCSCAKGGAGCGGNCGGAEGGCSCGKGGASCAASAECGATPSCRALGAQKPGGCGCGKSGA